MKAKRGTLKASKGRVTKAVSMDVALVEWAEGLARAQNRSLSNLVETILRDRKAGATVQG